MKLPLLSPCTLSCVTVSREPDRRPPVLQAVLRPDRLPPRQEDARIPGEGRVGVDGVVVLRVVLVFVPLRQPSGRGGAAQRSQGRERGAASVALL